jgi:hypothetical protein
MHWADDKCFPNYIDSWILICSEMGYQCTSISSETERKGVNLVRGAQNIVQ